MKIVHYEMLISALEAEGIYRPGYDVDLMHMTSQGVFGADLLEIEGVVHVGKDGVLGRKIRFRFEGRPNYGSVKVLLEHHTEWTGVTTEINLTGD